MDNQNTQVTIGSGASGNDRIPEHLLPVSTPPMKPARNFRPLIYGILVIVVVVIGVLWWHGRSNKTQALESRPAVVEIRASGFFPQTIQISKGQSVEWVNTDTKAHQVATDPFPLENGLAGFYDQVPTNTSQTYTFTFNKTGTFTYHDHLDPGGLKGTVVVK